ncbi:hypothetical protein I5907_02885 [Panacibacter sp. DH6]|uniref:Uncharacterized protein n=1 Tax=Panacibacter microcysteis TaxID=2793269 RepID=A0A931E6C1_9BACT|nr:hypothetical protein [Panacibacter microcysteis]MBG9375159.1 hypothetical protein [Panacibacter microcysteis]
MQTVTSLLKTTTLSLLILCLVISNRGLSQEPAIQKAAGVETKRFWKKNELLIGLGSALLFTGIVYAFWRKKKKGFGNLDSTL